MCENKYVQQILMMGVIKQRTWTTTKHKNICTQKLDTNKFNIVYKMKDITTMYSDKCKERRPSFRRRRCRISREWHPFTLFITGSYSYGPPYSLDTYERLNTPSPQYKKTDWYLLVNMFPPRSLGIWKALCRVRSE